MRSKLTIRVAHAALAAVTLATLSACAGSTEGKDIAYVARDVESLYAEAQRRLDRGNTLQAAALFDEVERQH
ncbi:outer membrane protein assembly factor BamD, partial [Klebsiella pneumoniae]|nr:outer membrane protein assembly factor BamD [Klebsiella pneumoniae]